MKLGAVVDNEQGVLQERLNVLLVFDVVGLIAVALDGEVAELDFVDALCQLVRQVRQFLEVVVGVERLVVRLYQEVEELLQGGQRVVILSSFCCSLCQLSSFQLSLLLEVLALTRCFVLFTSYSMGLLIANALTTVFNLLIFFILSCLAQLCSVLSVDLDELWHLSNDLRLEVKCDREWVLRHVQDLELAQFHQSCDEFQLELLLFVIQLIASHFKCF